MAYPGPTNDEPADTEGMGDVAGDDAAAGEMSSPDSGVVTLDKTNPDISEAFANCKVGDKYTVTADDEGTITLQKDDAEEEVETEPDSGDVMPKPKGAVAILIDRKKKR